MTQIFYFLFKKKHHLEELIEGIVKKLNEILIDKTPIVKNAILSLMFWAAENVTNLQLYKNFTKITGNFI